MFKELFIYGKPTIEQMEYLKRIGGLTFIPNLKGKNTINIAMHRCGRCYNVDLTKEQFKRLIIRMEEIANDEW